LADFYLLKSHSIGKLIIAQQIYSIMIVELILRYAISKPGRWKGRQLTQ